jgi:hypothetical protein
MTMWFVAWVVDVVSALALVDAPAAAFPLVWALYFTSSRRVANTYGSNAARPQTTGR